MPSPHRRRRRRSSQSGEHSKSRSRSHSHSHSRRSSSSSRTPPIDLATLWLSVAGIYWLMLVMAMHFPGHAIPPELRPAAGSDGLFHCAAYTIFAFLICRAFDALHRRKYPTVNPPALIYFFIFLLCITYGYVDEETQPWTGRTSDSGDWEANVLGSLFGVCAHLFVSVFFTADPAQLVVDRINRRRRHRRHSHRHRSGHRDGHAHSSDDSQSSEKGHAGDSDEERSRGEGRRRRRRRRRSSAETHDDASASEATIDDAPPVDLPPAAPQPEVPPPQPDAEARRNDEPESA